MAISRSQIPAQVDGKLRGARKNPMAKKLRSSKYKQKVIHSKKVYNRKRTIT
jgi:hypothetical protein|tara:strand:- start:656 stop:811 length:156 start_codon:yes stop_codon:yes gene_type:complete